MTRTRLTLDCLDDRALPSAGIGDLIALGADAGGPPRVNLLDTAGNVVGDFLAYDPAFTGGVRVALGDVTGDGRADIVTAAGVGGGPRVNVYDGTDGRLVRSFFAFEPEFRGGVTVAVGVLGGRPAVVTGRGAGGPPEVRAFDGVGGRLLLDFNAFEESFAGGVNVAVGDVLGTGSAQVVTAPGAGGGPRVGVFSGTTGQPLTTFFAYEPQFRGGLSVAAGALAGVGGRDVVVTGAGPGGGPRVSVLDGTTGQTLQTAFAYDPAFTGGVNVGVVSGTTGRPDRLLTAAGPGGGPQVNVYPGLTPVAAGALTAPTPAVLPSAAAFGTPVSFFALPATFTGGVGLGTGYAAGGVGFGVGTAAGSSLPTTPSAAVASLAVGSAGVVNSADLGTVGTGIVTNVGGTNSLGVGSAGLVNPLGRAGLGTVGTGTVTNVGGAGNFGIGTGAVANVGGSVAAGGLPGVVNQGVPLGTASPAIRVPYVLNSGFYATEFGLAPVALPGTTDAAQLTNRFRYRVG